MKKDSLISVIIPCYNDGEFIEKAIDSIISQTYPCSEIIVVDDGSNEKTKLVLDSLQNKITKLITQENKGQSTARNVGIEKAKGDFVLVLDSDDFFEPTFCEKAIDCFFKDEDIKLVTCYANLLFDKGISYIYEPQGGTIRDFIKSNNALGSAIYKKVDWELCGGYDETMTEGFEDWEFYIRLLKTSGKAEVVKEPLYNYRKRTTTTTSNANKNRCEITNYIYNKHKNIFISHYEDVVTYLLAKIQQEELEKVKNLHRKEFILGTQILKPFRWVKSIFR